MMNRPRGIYQVGVDGECSTRKFDVSAINFEAADRITELEAELDKRNELLFECLGDINDTLKFSNLTINDLHYYQDMCAKISAVLGDYKTGETK